MTGSELYQRLNKECFGKGNSDWDWVWHRHPFMVNAYTGRGDEHYTRYLEMLHWLRETMGRESDIFAKPPVIRRYRTGGATIDGWTWIGFTNQYDMNRFNNRWPAPEKIEA